MNHFVMSVNPSGTVRSTPFRLGLFDKTFSKGVCGRLAAITF
ncbi:hypothetical protein BI355_2021 [Companilactobacillus crustorum]|nr:hypothetical protein BI355_2021 [Companilactobacillus crustorum]